MQTWQALTLISDGSQGITMRQHSDVLASCLSGQRVQRKDQGAWAIVLCNVNYTPADMAAFNHWTPAWPLSEVSAEVRARAACLHSASCDDIS